MTDIEENVSPQENTKDNFHEKCLGYTIVEKVNDIESMPIIHRRLLKDEKVKHQLKKNRQEDNPEEGHDDTGTSVHSKNTTKQKQKEDKKKINDKKSSSPSSARFDIMQAGYNILKSSVDMAIIIFNEFTNKRLNTENIYSVDSLADIHQKFYSFLKVLEQNFHLVRKELKKYLVEWCKTVKYFSITRKNKYNAKENVDENHQSKNDIEEDVLKECHDVTNESVFSKNN